MSRHTMVGVLARTGVFGEMISLSSATGVVWYHTWYGTFISMQE